MDSNKKTSSIKINVLKNKVQIGFIILSMIFLNVNIFAQTKEWKTENTKDGKISVKSRISDRTNKEGKDVQLIEYVATTTAIVDMQNCIAVIKDVSKHKEFMDDEVSKIVKTISDNEWIVYYFTNSPWPMPDSDCVSTMTFLEDKDNGIATFILNATPTMFENGDVKRMTYYNVTYTFKDQGNGEIELTVTAKMSPVVQAPDWMVRGFFPKGPADVLREILKFAKNS